MKYTFDEGFHNEKHEIILFRKGVGSNFIFTGLFLTIFNVSWKFMISTEGQYTIFTQFRSLNYNYNLEDRDPTITWITKWYWN